MKHDYKLITIIVLVALCGIIFYVNSTLRSKVNSQASIIREKTDSITYHRNKQGELIAQKSAAEITAKELKEYYPKLAEEIKRDFDIKLKDVKAYVKNQFQAAGKGETITNNHYYVDSTGTKHFTQEMRIDDGYLSMDAVVLDSNRVSYNYLYADTITTVLSTHRKWFLGNEQLYATSKLQNKNARVTGATNILIKDHRDKRFVLSVGAYYDPFKQNYGAGVHFGYALFKF
jgi:hypothetical protein